MIRRMRQYNRRRIRLPLDQYAEHGSVWHVTMTSRHRRAILTDPCLAAALISSLETACANAKAPLLVHCLMPDHLHALIQIDEIDLIAIIRNFKSFSTRIWWSHGGEGNLWQRSAYDRGIRRTEYLDELIGYLFLNPVDAGEIEDWLDRGLLGGSLIEDGL